VMTLFLFVIMLIGVDKAEDFTENLPLQRTLSLGLLALFGAGIVIAGRLDWATGPRMSTGTVNGTVEAIGDELFRRWLLPFEITALLLIIAAAGTIALARFRGSEEEEEEVP
jgi:NADH-quinone oxidoreductase subunit J